MEEKPKPITYIRWHWAHWLSGRITRRPPIEQALFMNLQAMVMRDGGSLNLTRLMIVDIADSFGLPFDDIEEGLNNLIDREIIQSESSGNDRVITIKFIDDQIDRIQSTSKKRARAARKRWEDANACNGKQGDANASGSDASALGVDANAMQNKPLEKEKEKEKELKKDTPKPDSPSKDLIKTKWNAMAADYSLPKIRRMTDDLFTKYKRRVKEEPQFWQLVDEELRLLDEFVYKGNWLTFHWIVNSEGNMEKLLSGNYRRTDGKKPVTAAFREMFDRPADVPQDVFENILEQALTSEGEPRRNFDRLIQLFRSQRAS